MAEGSEVADLEMLTRALVGITLQSLEVLGGEVSLPQFRVLLTASTLGRAPSSRLAEAGGIPASSVTRLADRLEAAGLLVRGADAQPLDRHDRATSFPEITARSVTAVTALRAVRPANAK
jgi:DNA-binding MarR family transcriptional regulator